MRLRPRKPTRRNRRFLSPRVSLRSPRLRGEVLNLSAGGAAIETTDTPPQIGADMLCELEDEHTAAVVQCEIRWCRFGGTALKDDGESTPVYRAGIRFINGSPRNLLRILRAVSLHRPRASGS